MSTNQEGPGGWVRESTPHDTDWTEDSEYGVALGEWDDYSSDQADPTPTPPPPVAESVPESSVEPEGSTETDKADDDATEPVADSAPDGDRAAAADEREPEVVPEPEPELVPEPESAEPTPEPDPTPEPEQAVEPEPVEATTGPEPDLLAVEDLDARDAEEQVRPRPAAFAAESSVDEPPLEDPSESTPAISGAGFGRLASAPVQPEPLDEDTAASVDPGARDAAPREDSGPFVDAPFGAVDQMGIEDDDPDAVPAGAAAGLVPAGDERYPEEQPGDVLPGEEDVSSSEQVANDAVEDAGPDATPLGEAAMTQETQQIDVLFREPAAEATAVIDPAISQRLEAERSEEERRAREFQALREERDARLGVVSTSQENASRPVQPKQKLVTDKFLGSFGLFVLRLIVASIAGVVGYQVLSNIDATSEFLGGTLLPEPRLIAWIVGFALGGIAVLLLIGLLVRVAAFVLLVLSVGSLVFVRWGAFSVLVPGMEGFLGDRDLLMAGVSLLLLCLGGGRWGIDGAFRAARANAREAGQA